jgi:predicted TIM-barrel fold metal-dependent hydrolase
MIATAERLISADDHVNIGHQDVIDRLPKKIAESYREAIAGELAALQARLAAQGGRLDNPSGRPGYIDPVERLKDMDADGIEAQVMYSELSGFRFFTLGGDDWREIAVANSNALADFAAVNPKRLLVSYQLPIMDVDFALKELERLIGLGARSVHLPNFPSDIGLPEYYDPVYEPLWAALSEAKIPITHHLGGKASTSDRFDRDPTPQRGIACALTPFGLMETLAFWIGPGILEKFPDLKIVLVESGISWIPSVLDTLDLTYRLPSFDFPALKMKPSEYWRRQMHCTFINDELGVQRLRDIVGVENIMWSSDYPHPQTSFPRSREVVEHDFAGLPPDERELILWGNAARLYGL